MRWALPTALWSTCIAFAVTPVSAASLAADYPASSSTTVAAMSATDQVSKPGTAAAGKPCKTGSRILFFSPDPLLDVRTTAGFADSLMRQLQAPLAELGYCLEEAGHYRAILDTARFAENLILQTQVNEDTADTEGSGTLLVAMLRVRELARGNLAEAVSHPLVSLHFEPGEMSSLPNILGKKISENLRSQYVADLLIRSHPTGAMVRTASGLDGATPVEWVMPLGVLQVSLEKKGWLPLKREIDLSAPGLHAYELQLSKRRFYNSKFIYPTLAAGVISVIAFGLENHYYSTYQALGAQDRTLRPETFGNTYQTAKTYEGVAYTALGLAWLNLALCFTF
ncbi:MAG: PEGA domain-containing protein [Fibrobacteria bacterium]